MSAHATHVQRRGFTLVEMLIALAVLVVGLASVMALVLGSTRMSVSAIERDTANIILSEAVDDISRIHLITKEQLPAPLKADIGKYIETSTATPADWPNIHSGPYSVSGNVRVGSQYLIWYKNLQAPNTMVWPPSTDPRYYGGPIRAGGMATGTPYRVIYRLERHPDWVESITARVPSAFEGVYVLTLAVYKDLQPRELIRDNPAHKFEQISDPMVVYLQQKI